MFFGIYIAIVAFLFFALLFCIGLLFKHTSKREKSYHAIANTYISICLGDLQTGKFKEIYSVEYVRSLVGKSGNSQEALEKTVNGFVTETYINRMKEFTNLQTLEERLAGKKIISQEYEGPAVGWCRTSFIPVSYDNNGHLKLFLYTAQPIQGEVLSLRDKLNIEETLLECVLTLSENTDADKSIQQLLANIATFHSADRSYVFEIDNINKTVRNSYEWCRKGIEPQIQNLQDLKIQDIQMFINLCKMELLKLADINYFTEDSVEYKLLESQKVTSLMCMPLIRDGEMIGFIGVDNPHINRNIESVLKSVTSFVITELEKKQFMSELYELSYKDKMTGVYNRHANMKYLSECSLNVQNIGIIYGDVNGLKETNDKYGHEYGDNLIINAAQVLKKIYNRPDDKIYRMGGDEFVVVCENISEEDFNNAYKNLIADLSQERILSTGCSWAAQCKNISEHIKVAEHQMYENKKIFYQTRDSK